MQGESQTLDFKFRIDDQKKIARTLCAFANSIGGRLLIGVKDNGKISGVDPQEEFYMIEGAAKVFCHPELSFKTKIWQEDFKLVLEVLVDKSESGPHRAIDESGKLKAYVRIGDKTIAANKILERVWLQKKSVHSAPEKFDEAELKLLKNIKHFQPVSISKLYRVTEMPLKSIDKLLVLLICWGVVEMVFSQEGVLYRLTEEKSFS